jgi:cytochrome c
LKLDGVFKGLDTLPPAQGASIWYSYNNSREQIPEYAREPAFPEFGQGPSNAVVVGPLYRFDSSLVSEQKLPAKYDGMLFVADWGRSFVKTVKIDAQGNPGAIDPFKDGSLQEPIVETDKDGNFLRIYYLPSPVHSPMDLTMGPDGTLYMLCRGQWNYPHSFPDDGTLIAMADPATIGIKDSFYQRSVIRKLPPSESGRAASPGRAFGPGCGGIS